MENPRDYSSRSISSRVIGNPTWSNAADTCVLSDDERHLGHIVQARGWQAFDATKMNDSGDGYRYIGAFRSRREAKQAVEASVLGAGSERTMSAGGGTSQPH